MMYAIKDLSKYLVRLEKIKIIFYKKFITKNSVVMTKECVMSQPNPNDTKFEQQRSDAAKASLKDQTGNNQDNNSESAAENNEAPQQDN